MNDFFAGASDVWRGWGFLVSRPRLWFWAAIPFLINLLLFAGLAWLGWHYFSSWVDPYLSAREAWWAEALGWFVRILFWMLVALVMVFTFVPLASIISAPFNDILSDKVERLYCGQGVDESFSAGQFARGLWIGTKGSVLLGIKTLGLVILALPLYLIPVFGAVLGPAAQAAITIRFLALEHTSYSMDRRYYTYRQRQAFLRDFRSRTLGLGAMAFVIMMVPIVNALFIPVSAVAGTILFCDTELKRAVTRGATAAP